MSKSDYIRELSKQCMFGRVKYFLVFIADFVDKNSRIPSSSWQRKKWAEIQNKQGLSIIL